MLSFVVSPVPDLMVKLFILSRFSRRIVAGREQRLLMVRIKSAVSYQISPAIRHSLVWTQSFDLHVSFHGGS
jgi:hypothetical protein